MKSKNYQDIFNYVYIKPQGTIFIPAEVAERFDMGLIDTYMDLFHIWKEESVIDEIYEAYCSECGTYGGRYETINSIPNDLVCSKCGVNLGNDPLRTMTVLFIRR